MPKSLPARPSQESLRKQAKKLSARCWREHRGARARSARCPTLNSRCRCGMPSSCWLGEYGYRRLAGSFCCGAQASWARASRWAADQAERAIHDNDLERLKRVAGGVSRAVVVGP